MQDFKKGNVVYNGQFHLLTEDEANEWYQAKIKKSIDKKHYQAVKLDNDWFIKLGFERYQNTFKSIDNPSHIVYIDFRDEGNKYLAVNSGRESLQVDYVHELQNVFDIEQIKI